MKKLYILLIALFTIITLPGLQTQAALTPPALFDYSFVYDATDGEFQFKDGTNSYTPEFTRIADGIYFNYTWTGNADGLLPFEITLTFNRSNTSWTFGTTGYIATDTKIGSDSNVGTTTDKFNFLLTNDTNDDYYLYFDFTSTNSGTIYGELKYNNLFQSAFIAGSLYRVQIVTNQSSFTQLIQPSYYDLNFYLLPTILNWYTDAIYWQNLGTSEAVQSTTAYDSGFTDGYNDGYTQGVQEDNAYSLGYALGLSEGQDMETGSSIIILVLAALSFAFMLFGFTSKKRIFNLFASGLFIVVGGLLIEYPAFIIVTIGFVIFNLYYTFVSD